MKSLLSTLLIFCFNFIFGQFPKFYTFTNDSLFLKENERSILIYYTGHACFDCFIHINEQLHLDTSLNYYFIIEKSSEAMANYTAYTKLITNGVSKERILFTKTQSHEISPFIKIHNKRQVLYIPYSDVFEDKATLKLSKKLKKEVGLE